MLVYTLVGLAVGIVGTLLVLRYKDADMANGKKALVLALWAVGLILIGFSCDWGYAAVAEGEPQSMAMGFLVFGGIAVLIWFKKDNLRIEYDYTFTNGDLDVGKVFGNARRKLMTSLSMKNVEACGPVTDPSFQRYITMRDVKKHNWFVNREAELYYFYFVKNSVKHIIVLETSREMIDMLRPYLNYGVWNEKA